jgi:hypothetical protein
MLSFQTFDKNNGKALENPEIEGFGFCTFDRNHKQLPIAPLSEFPSERPPIFFRRHQVLSDSFFGRHRPGKNPAIFK